MIDDVRVRAADGADAPAIAAIYRPIVLGTAISFEATPPDENEIKHRMAAAPRLPWLVATHGDGVVGYAYAAHHRQRAAYRWSAECSAYVAEGQRGQGVGHLLYARLLEELRGLGYVSLLAGITLPNRVSVRLHEALGFHLVGVFRRVGFKHGAWHDVAWWQLSLSDPPDDPREPRGWSAR